jgi:antitoxin (DNA-binding transcriptional repressor) of toxin-antitoxin stability system
MALVLGKRRGAWSFGENGAGSQPLLRSAESNEKAAETYLYQMKWAKGVDTCLCASYLCGKMKVRVCNIREAQHNLAGILREVEGGTTVEIRRRKVPVARIVPVGSGGSGEPVDWSGHAGRMAAVWGERPVEGVDAVMDDLREDG